MGSKLTNPKTKRVTLFSITFLFITLILTTAWWFTNFKYGRLIQSGDLRLHIHPDVIGDQFLNLVSHKFSNNNFIYLSFYSLFWLLNHLPYHLTLVYIFLLIPVFLFLSSLYLLVKVTHYDYKKHSVTHYFFLSSLAFYFAINPAFFGRLGHYTILHSTIFLPFLIYTLYRFLLGQAIINRFLFLFLFFLYLGGSNPNMIVITNFAVGIVYISVFLLSKPNLLTHLKKGLLVGSIILFSQLHLIYPMLIGQGTAKSPRESETTSLVLNSLSRHSNIFTAMSGTNYYDGLIKYPNQIGVGLLIFVLAVVFLIIYGTRNPINSILLILTLLSLIITTGYKIYPLFYDVLNNTPLRSFTWLLKDPNMYYLIFLIPLLVLFSRVTLLNLRNRWAILTISVFILIVNLLFTFSTNKREFNQFFDFIKVPDYYFTLGEKLKRLEGRNFWIPYNTYVSKNFSKEITYFPNPALWLTQNKELTDETQPYQELIKIIENEIFNKGCQNIHFLDWVIATQDLNVIVDKNSVNNPKLETDNIEEKIEKTNLCIGKIPNIEQVVNQNGIEVYKSKLEIRDKVYIYKGTIDSLNEFLVNNPVNIILEPSSIETVERVELKNFTILNESFDNNWLDSNGNPPINKVNLTSILFQAPDNKFSYRGAKEFKLITIVQRTITLLIIIGFVIKSASTFIFKKQND